MRCEVLVSISSDMLVKLANATPDVIGRVNDLLEGRLEVPNAASVDIGVITFESAAKQTGVSVPTMYRLANSGKVATVRLGGGTRRILRSSLVDYFSCRRGAAPMC